jgi:hypothetical protein
MAILDTVKVIVEEIKMVISGGDFTEMLNAVKLIEGRDWVKAQKAWKLPCSLMEAKELLSEYQIQEEEEVIDAEILQIEKYQGWILEDIPKLEEEYKMLERGGGGYSKAGGRNKATKKTMAYCLRMAIVSAKKSAAVLTQPEIAGMRRACEIMGWV